MLYFIDRIPDFLPTGIISVIPEERLIKAERYNRVSDNILCKLAYYVFAYGMEKEYGVPIGSKLRWENAENGKPFFSGYPYINFNISHCEKAVFCGLSNYPIGVDVQDVISDTESLWHMVCTDGERERLKASSEPDKLFTWFWKRDIATFKYIRTAIARRIDSRPVHRLVAIVFASVPERALPHTTMLLHKNSRLANNRRFAVQKWRRLRTDSYNLPI